MIVTVSSASPWIGPSNGLRANSVRAKESRLGTTTPPGLLEAA